MEKNLISNKIGPLVSIVIPVYNGSNYLAEAIDSALNQTYKNIEIIVVNDGSCDDGKTEEIALSYGDKIRYFSKENGGVSTALNLGISKMNGEYFSWLSHDDKYAPTKIENQIRLLNKYKEENLIAICATELIDKDSNSIVKKSLFNGKERISWEEGLVWTFQKGAFNGCSLLIPKHVFEKCGVFDEKMRYTQDVFMWIKMFLSKYEMVYENSFDSLMRMHNQQLSQTGKNLFREDSKNIAIWLAPRLAELDRNASELLYLYTRRNAVMGNKDAVKNCLLIAKEKRLFKFKHKFLLRVFSFYGKIRPFIRKIYYRLFKKVKTN